MPVHYGCADLNFMTISSPLGTQIPQATGYAFGQKMDKTGKCTICYFGEGASEGDFHAALNISVYKVPVISFVVTTVTPFQRRRKVSNMAVMALRHAVLVMA